MTARTNAGSCILCDQGGLDAADTVCDNCTQRVVMFVSAAAQPAIVGLWPILDAPRPAEPSNEDDIAEAVVQGAASLNLDAQAHACLAAGFLDMGLLADAAREAIAALRASTGIDPASRDAALNVLLDERVGGKRIVDDLRRVLRGRGWG